jgi:hypothetical protein
MGRTLAEQMKDLGREELMAKGRIESAQASLLKVLETRHGALPKGLSEAIREVRDLSKLEELLVTALRTDSFEAFTAAL